VAVIIILAIVFPATLEAPADPTSTTYNPRPEWYFLFFFQFLKFFPGWLEPVAAAIIPAVALIIFILIPLIDRGYKRRWSDRKVGVGVGVLAVGAFAALVVAGALSAPARPAGEASPLVQSGREVYTEVNCAYCHSIGGAGGTIGPDLSIVGGQLDPAQLQVYLRDPHAMVPTTLHPKLQFTEEELDALVAYLETLGAPSASAKRPKGYMKRTAPAATW
jgi:mono/diheme cytochrome c family protein